MPPHLFGEPGRVGAGAGTPGSGVRNSSRGGPAAGSTPGGSGSGSKALSDGLRVRGPNGAEYQVCEDWPRRGDAAGDTYRALRRDLEGNETVVALKVAKACFGASAVPSATTASDVASAAAAAAAAVGGQAAPVSPTNAAAARAWEQEVRLLRRLALLGRSQQLRYQEDGEEQQQQGGRDRGSSSSTVGPHYTVEMITEFGGIRGMPALRFLVTTPVCWKSLDARIKAVERGYMEAYDGEQALKWCWQIARGLWSLQEADIGYTRLSLRHILLTAPDGDVRLAGFDALLGADQATASSRQSSSSSSRQQQKQQQQAPDEACWDWDSRKGLWDLGRVLHMTLTCSTDREDDRNYFLVGRRDALLAAACLQRGDGVAGDSGSDWPGAAAGGASRRPRRSQQSSSSLAFTSARPFLAALPPAARPVVLGLLAPDPSLALPLGMALDNLAELVGVDVESDAGLARRHLLRPLEARWWACVGRLHQEEEDEESGGVVERKASAGPAGIGGARGARLELARACLAMGAEWERQDKVLKALELYGDAAALAGAEEGAGAAGAAGPEGTVVTEAWGRTADLRQSQGHHAAACEVLERLVKRFEAELRAAMGTASVASPAGNASEAKTDPAAWRAAVAQQAREEAAERLAGARVRLATSLREMGEARLALAQLNAAQRELQAGGSGAADGGQGMVRVLTGKAAIYSQRGDHLRALEMYEDALERRRRAVGSKEDPELAALLVSMAEVYAKKGDTDVALQMLIGAYKRMAEAPPAAVAAQGDGLLMAATLERIGALFTQKGQLDDALMCYKAAHERKSAVLARAHPSVAATLAATADLHERRGDHRAAATVHARALEIRRAVLAPTSPELAASLYGLANAQQRLKAHRSALRAYEEAEAIRRVADGGASVRLGDVLVNMSRPLKALNRDAEAVAKLREARDVYRQAGLGPEDPRVCTVQDNLRVLGALAQGKGPEGSSGSGSTGGSRVTGVLTIGGADPAERRERLLKHHASATTRGVPLPAGALANTQQPVAGRRKASGNGRVASVPAAGVTPAAGAAKGRGKRSGSSGCTIS